MLHKEIIGLTLLLWLGWIFISPSGTDRIQRFCAPVGWVGNVAVSGAALASPDSQKAVGKTMDKVTYGCEYMVWRLFYQSTYNAYIHSQKNFGEDGEPVAPKDDAEAADAEEPVSPKAKSKKSKAADAEADLPADAVPAPVAPGAEPAEPPVKKKVAPPEPKPEQKPEQKPTASAAKPVRVIE